MLVDRILMFGTSLGRKLSHHKAPGPGDQPCGGPVHSSLMDSRGPRRQGDIFATMPCTEDLRNSLVIGLDFYMCRPSKRSPRESKPLDSIACSSASLLPMGKANLRWLWFTANKLCNGSL